MKIVQVMLRSPEGELFTTWVDKRPDLKKGAEITLKDLKPEMKWLVTAVFDQEHDAADFDFHRKWDNNNYDKHEGLKV